MPTLTPRALSLVSLCVHYSVLSAVMHYSRTHIPPDKTYKASSAVVLTELGKLTLSLVMAVRDIHKKRKERYFLIGQQEEREGEVLFDDTEEDAEERHSSSNSRTKANGLGHVRQRSSVTVRMEDPSNSFANSRPLPIKNHAHGRSTSISVAIPLSPLRSESSHRSTRSTGSARSFGTMGSSDWEQNMWERLKAEVFEKGWYKLAIPAVMFVVQNNLQYVASENLSVAVFQITYQLKILTTALCSVLILHRALYVHQWLSLFILTFGVALVQISSIPTSTSDSSPTTKAIAAPLATEKASFKFPTLGKDSAELQIQYQEGDMNQLIGLLAVILACFSSGFASVYFEKKLKTGNQEPASKATPSIAQGENNDTDPSSPPTSLTEPRRPSPPPSLWIRNIQLSTFGLVMGLLIVVFESSKDTMAQNFLWAANFMDPSTPSQPPNVTAIPIDPVASFLTPLSPHNILENFTPLVYFVVFLQIIGGLLNALVMLHADNIAKGFATSCSILLSFAVEVGWWGRELKAGVVVGSFLVGGATYLFARREGGLLGR
ncbi:hypothetical protein BT69DRAFT_1211920 [Atractiella rhizophila]|nr:hypothetical protein BT69DRAFT_1211920 [Atractiella rhizophila]